MAKRPPTARLLAILLAAGLPGCSAPAATPVMTEQERLDSFRARFLHFCDLATAELNKEVSIFRDRENADPRHPPHAVLRGRPRRPGPGGGL